MKVFSELRESKYNGDGMLQSDKLTIVCEVLHATETRVSVKVLAPDDDPGKADLILYSVLLCENTYYKTAKDSISEFAGKAIANFFESALEARGSSSEIGV